jgi:hypothetical protein
MNSPDPSLEFLCDVCTIAAESGIDHWARIVKYRWADDATKAPLPFPVAMIEFEEARSGSKQTLLLTPDHLRRGIRRIANGQVNIAARLREQILEAVNEDDASNIDAELSDCIVQASVFDELVYS